MTSKARCAAYAGRWVLHDLGDVRERGEMLTNNNWHAAAVTAPEAQVCVEGGAGGGG